MKYFIFIFLAFVCSAICLGQNELLTKKRPQRFIRTPELSIPHLPQNRVFGDLNEQVDSTWTRQYGGPQVGNATSRRSFYTYNQNHMLASESYLDFYLQSGEQYNGRQEEYFYNEMEICTLHYTNEQDLDSKEWIRKDREEIFWNPQELSGEYIRSAWNENLKKFENVSKSIWTNITFNQTEENTYFSWDGNNWQFESKYKYEYNNADSIKAIYIYDWIEDSGEWQLNYKSEYFYTNETRLDSIIDSLDEGFGLEPYDKEILLYNIENLLESDIYFKWDGNGWETLSMNTFDYTPDGKETLWTYFEWDPDEERFVENYYEANTYTSAGDPWQYTIADYNTDTEVWEPWWIKESFYDENVDGSTIVWPNPAFYAPVTFHHKPIFDVQYFFDGFEWSFADSLLFFYGNLNTSTFHTKALTANIFPNPATNQMTIQMEELDPSATITFFDLQGKHVGSSPLRSNIPISISGLIPGTYVYQIHNGTEFYSGKILKE